MIPQESPSKPRNSCWEFPALGPGHLGLTFQLLSALGFVERNEQNVSGQLERWQGGSLPGSADAGSRGRGPGSLELLPEPVPKWPQPLLPTDSRSPGCRMVLPGEGYGERRQAPWDQVLQ